MKKIVKIGLSAKASDLHFVQIYFEDGSTREHDGYNPGVCGSGDYTKLEIDNETGKIIGWKPLQLSDLFEDEE